MQRCPSEKACIHRLDGWGMPIMNDAAAVTPNAVQGRLLETTRS